MGRRSISRQSHVLAHPSHTPPPFRDPKLPFAKHIDDLPSRLGIDAFRTGQEALHGVAWRRPARCAPATTASA
jgi:beta-glucosidase